MPDFGLFPLFQSFAGADAVGSTIVLAHGRDTEVRVLDDDFNLRTIIRWFEPDREVTGADVRAWREDYTRSRNQPASVPWSRFDDARVSSNRPVADLFPSISTVMIGKDGRIWVRQYDRPREDRGWLGFSPGGEFVCHLGQLPGSVWEFGDDYVLLLRESELGIQTVALHRLETPTGQASAPDPRLPPPLQRPRHLVETPSHEPPEQQHHQRREEALERVGRHVAAAPLAESLQTLLPPRREQDAVAHLRAPDQQVRRFHDLDPFGLLQLQRSQGDVQINRRPDLEIRLDPCRERIPFTVSFNVGQ